MQNKHKLFCTKLTLEANFAFPVPLANSYFQFKQFQVVQNHAAMRVSTDACLFGAWIQLNGARQVLDIGTGTGLLPLMLAQRFPETHFTAVEVESGACTDAAANFMTAPWNNRLRLIQEDVRHWQTAETFDAIVCNPPFFMHDLPNPEQRKQLARHGQSGLSPEALMKAVNRLLRSDGHLYVMLPPQTIIMLERCASALGWFPVKRCVVRHVPEKQAHLHFVVFARNGQPPASEEQLMLKTGDAYSVRATELLAPYYLFLDAGSVADSNSRS
jgi:tRNA1Val (adenine37-N6)-methyltransferase